MAVNNIQITPKVIQNILTAKIEMSDYNVGQSLLFVITARRNDGLRVTKEFLFPNETSDPEVGLFVSMFPVNKLNSFQIVEASINDIEVNQYFTKIYDDIEARYDDSYMDLASIIDMTHVDIDFTILLTHDPKKIVLADSSSWGVLNLSPTFIDVKIPGNENLFTFYWDKGSLNTYTSPMFKTVGNDDCSISFDEFPDGVYEFTLRSGNSVKHKVFGRHLKMDSVRLKLDNLMVRAAIVPDDIDRELLSKVNEIYDLIAFAESSMRVGNLKSVSYLLCLIEEKIEQANECNNC